MARVDVLETRFARVEIDREARLVTLVRSAAPLTAETIERAIDDFQLAVPLRERPRLVLLQDMRLAPPIRDEALEQALAPIVPRLTAKFAARAVLLQTAIGNLQAARFVRQVGGEARTFTDESEARKYLLEHAARLVAG